MQAPLCNDSYLGDVHKGDYLTRSSPYISNFEAFWVLTQL